MNMCRFPARARLVGPTLRSRGVLRFAAAAWSVAATAAAGPTLSVDDCIRAALEHNERLTVAGLAVRAAEDRARVAGAPQLPQASLRGGASYAPFDGYDPALSEGGELAARVEVSQWVYDGGATRLGKQQAELEIGAATAERLRLAADLRLEVRLAFVDLLSATRRTRLVESSIADLESNLESVRRLAHGGAVPKTDILKVEIQLQNERLDLEDLRTGKLRAELGLAELMGLEPGTRPAIEDTVRLPSLPAAFEPRATYEQQAAERDVRAATLERAARRAERRPVLALLASAGAWTSRSQLLETDSPHVLGYQAGVTLEMPLWDGGALAARVAEQGATLRAREADSRLLARRLRTEHAAAAAESRTAVDKLAHLAANRDRATEQYALLLAQYVGGNTRGLEVLDAHRSLLEVELQAERVQSDLERLQARLLRLAGEER